MSDVETTTNVFVISRIEELQERLNRVKGRVPSCTIDQQALKRKFRQDWVQAAEGLPPNAADRRKFLKLLKYLQPLVCSPQLVILHSLFDGV